VTLRQDVLQGRFTGRTEAAGDLATVVASADAATTLRVWFGEEWLAGLARQPNRADILRAAIDRDIAAIDALLSRQLDAVMQHPRFTRLEGSWRGVDWLVDRAQPGSRVRVRLLHARWGEICRDLERALEFDQSHLFRKIYEEEFGTAGGEPFGLIAADYQVRHRPSEDHPTDDVGTLIRLAAVSAAAFAPTVLAAAPSLLGLDSFADASSSVDLSTVFRAADYQRWRNMGHQDDLRFLGIVLPRMLARAPWPDDGIRPDRFRFRSHTPGPRQRVWMSPVYGLAAVAIRAFERNSWPAAVRGAEISLEPQGGVLDDLPTERLPSDADRRPPRAPLEIALTDDQETQLGELGLIPLSALEGLPEACFGALPSLHRPPRMSTAVANANQRLSTQLNTLLCVSRFAHFIKLMGRDMVGSTMDPRDIQLRLGRWLSGYISGLGTGGAGENARYPLQDAKVDVFEHPGRPGSYGCVIHLMPHHQLDEIGASFRFTTELASRQAAA
jgi:type VI secretion system ImpC/EvpB family protein